MNWFCVQSLPGNARAKTDVTSSHLESIIGGFVSTSEVTAIAQKAVEGLGGRQVVMRVGVRVTRATTST